MNVLKVLAELGIKFELLEHEAVYTVEESRRLRIFEKLNGQPCKNLFLRNKRGEYFLLVLLTDKRADLKLVAKLLNLPRLSFASEEELEKILGLHTGAVTPLGIINDDAIRLIIDAELQNKILLLHPNTNTATISIAFADLLKIILHTEHKYSLSEL